MRDFDFADLAASMERIASDPAAAAQQLRDAAAEMLLLAEQLEQQSASGFRDPGGMADRVRMNVVGPDGKIKQSVDTGRG